MNLALLQQYKAKRPFLSCACSALCDYHYFPLNSSAQNIVTQLRNLEEQTADTERT